MRYYTVKLNVPDQVVFVPSDCEFLEVLEPGSVKDPATNTFNDAECAHLLARVYSSYENMSDISLRPRRILCAPLTDYGSGQQVISNSPIAGMGHDMDGVFSEAYVLTYLGKFTIKRGGMTLTYLVSAENPNVPTSAYGGVGFSPVQGDSSTGTVDNALPRALT